MKLSDIAQQLGTSEKNLKRALSIERNLTESMKELLDTGVITKTLAADTITVTVAIIFTFIIKYKGFRECHIQPNWLLVYLFENDILTLTLVDTGTHSNLFDM